MTMTETKWRQWNTIPNADNDLISRKAAKEEIRTWAVRINDPANLSTADTMTVLDTLPTVDAVEANTIRRILNSECVRLYRADEEMLERMGMGGYNPSSFMAGFQYALDCITGKFTQIK